MCIYLKETICKIKSLEYKPKTIPDPEEQLTDLY